VARLLDADGLLTTEQLANVIDRRDRYDRARLDGRTREGRAWHDAWLRASELIFALEESGELVRVRTPGGCEVFYLTVADARLLQTEVAEALAHARDCAREVAS